MWGLTTSGGVPALASIAAAAPFPGSDHDGGFFTSVSSDGTTANTAIIWAVGRPATSDTNNFVTLYAVNATPSGASLPLLWHGTAGAWPSTNANPNIVPTVANGRVYVASYQQLQIFGLITPRIHKRFTGEFLAALPALPPPSGPQFFGTVKSIEGTHMVLELRTGRSLEVDVSGAIKTGHIALLRPGQSAQVKGSMGKDRVFNANVVIRAKGRSLWGSDKEQ
jgi:hypothetical protein